MNDIGININSLLSSFIFGNLGNLGGFRNDNSFALMSVVLKHYQKDGGYYIEGGPSMLTRALMPVIEKNGGRCLGKLNNINYIYIVFVILYQC